MYIAYVRKSRSRASAKSGDNLTKKTQNSNAT